MKPDKDIKERLMKPVSGDGRAKLTMKKNFKHGGHWYMVYCPECGLENYAPMVASGKCAWCGFVLKDAVPRSEQSEEEGA